MSAEPRAFDLQPPPVVLFVGNYGSGKTEVAVNYAIALADGGARVRIADLDLVNPYFRCREARDLLAAHGVASVLPSEEMMHADLPILTPEVKGMVQHGEGFSVLDVGGDDVGATVLASLAPAFRDRGHELLMVVNERRPFTETAEAVLKIMNEIERASQLKITGLVSNAHLIEETTPETVYSGLALTREVSALSSLPLRFVAVMEEVADSLESARLGGASLLRMQRRLLPPWRRKTETGSSTFSLCGKV